MLVNFVISRVSNWFFKINFIFASHLIISYPFPWIFFHNLFKVLKHNYFKALFRMLHYFCSVWTEFSSVAVSI